MTEELAQAYIDAVRQIADSPKLAHIADYDDRFLTAHMELMVQMLLDEGQK